MALGAQQQSGNNYLGDTLRVLGTNLGAATALLVGPGGAAQSLEVCAAQDTAMDLVLPPGLSAGQYTLSVINAAGSCGQGLTLLQGEPGVPGSLDASGAQIVVSINDTLLTGEATLRGTWAGDVQTLVAVGNAIDPSAAKLKFNGTTVVAGVTAGFYVAVFDPVDDVEPTGHAFLTTGTNSAADFALFLSSLSPGEVVLAASAGDVTSMASHAPLGAAFRGLGGTQFSNFTSSTAYILIAQVGAGYPLERKVTSGLGGYVRLATGFLDGTFISVPTPPELPTAGASQAGLLTASDFSSFNSRVSNVTAGTGVSVTSSGTSRTIAVNYGATSSTAAAGNDSRLSDARAPTSGSNHYIQAQYVSGQSVNFRISGTGRVGALVSDGDAMITGNVAVGGAVSFNPALTTHEVAATGDGSVQTVNVSNKTFCSLSGVDFPGDGGTVRKCRISKSGATWTLSARSGTVGTTTCQMLCF